MERNYAQAVFNLLHRDGAHEEQVLQQLQTHLAAVGREKLLPRILDELAQLYKRSEALGTTLEVASEGERAAAEREAEQLGVSATATINASLVRGWRAQIGSRVIDRSGKRALLDLYRTIVTSA